MIVSGISIIHIDFLFKMAVLQLFIYWSFWISMSTKYKQVFIISPPSQRSMNIVHMSLVLCTQVQTLLFCLISCIVIIETYSQINFIRNPNQLSIFYRWNSNWKIKQERIKAYQDKKVQQWPVNFIIFYYNLRPCNYN